MAIKLLNGFERVATAAVSLYNNAAQRAINEGEMIFFPAETNPEGLVAGEEVPVVLFYSLLEDYTLGAGLGDENLLSLRIWGRMTALGSVPNNPDDFPVLMDELSLADGDNQPNELPVMLSYEGLDENGDAATIEVAKLTMVAVGPLNRQIDILRNEVPGTLTPTGAAVDVGGGKLLPVGKGGRFRNGFFGALDALKKLTLAGKDIFPAAGAGGANAYQLPALPANGPATLARERPARFLGGRRGEGLVSRKIISDSEGDLVAILSLGDISTTFMIAASSLTALNAAAANPGSELEFGREQDGNLAGISFDDAEVIRTPGYVDITGGSPVILFGNFGNRDVPTAKQVYDAWKEKPAIEVQKYESLAAFAYGMFSNLFGGKIQAKDALFIGQKKQVRFYESATQPDGADDDFKNPNVAAGDIVRVGDVMWRCADAPQNADATWKRMGPNIAAGVVSGTGMKVAGFGFSVEREPGEDQGKYAITFDDVLPAGVDYGVTITSQGEWTDTNSRPLVGRYYEKGAAGFKVNLLSSATGARTAQNPTSVQDAEFSFVATRY